MICPRRPCFPMKSWTTIRRCRHGQKRTDQALEEGACANKLRSLDAKIQPVSLDQSPNTEERADLTDSNPYEAGNWSIFREAAVRGTVDLNGRILCGGRRPSRHAANFHTDKK